MNRMRVGRPYNLVRLRCRNRIFSSKCPGQLWVLNVTRNYAKLKWTGREVDSLLLSSVEVFFKKSNVTVPPLSHTSLRRRA